MVEGMGGYGSAPPPSAEAVAMRAMQDSFANAHAKASSKPTARFQDPWFRSFDKPTHGYRDSTGFVNRLPLRLQSEELMVYGFVDPSKLWAEYHDEAFTPILVGDKVGQSHHGASLLTVSVCR